MALETLRGIKHIGGFDVADMDGLRDKHPEKFNESGAMDWQWFEKDIRPNHFIYLRRGKNSLSFTIQDGPIKENGVNGCQVDTIIQASKEILTGLNNQYPSSRNLAAIGYLNLALSALQKRTEEREARGVEGTNKK